jgi:hypothetical protein
MTETKRQPLLADQLPNHERAMLGQLVHAPAFKVIDKFYEAVLVRATQDMSKLDPEDADYERKIVARTQRSRYFNECIKLIRDSIDFHLESEKSEAQENEVAAVDAVAKTFGIHKVPKKKSPSGA